MLAAFMVAFYIEKNRESGSMELVSFSCHFPLGGFGGPEKDLGRLRWS